MLGKSANWKIYGLAFVLTMIAEFIGTQKFDFGIIAFSLFPMLYVLIMGAALGAAKVIQRDMMEDASPFIGISVALLTTKVGAGIGPNLSAVFQAGPALILQEFGNVATALFALPFAVLVLHMGREAVGASFSISRETSIAIVANKWGLDGDEGVGVMGAYAVGTVLGTLFYGIICGILCDTGLFHPYSLGMACGTGSASMMSASLAACTEAFPEYAAEMAAYAASSQILSSVDGLYMSLFLAIPCTEWMYKMFTKNNKHYKDGQPINRIKK